MPKRPSAESLDTALDEPILTVCREATTDQSESEECEKEAAQRSTSPYTPLYTNGSIRHLCSRLADLSKYIAGQVSLLLLEAGGLLILLLY